jgi:CHAT domain-containing protein
MYANLVYPKITKKDKVKTLKLKRYKQKIATLEQKIIQGDPRFKTEKSLQIINSQTIADGLSEKELYIDYGKTSDSYYLFTIDHNNTISFNAFSEEDSKAIDKQVTHFNNNIASSIEAIGVTPNVSKNKLKDESQQILSRLYELLITQSLQQQLTDKNSLIISPDGALRLLPFEALYQQDKKQYLIEKKDIRYIASGKELVRLFRQQQKNQVENTNKAMLFADPDLVHLRIKQQIAPLLPIPIIRPEADYVLGNLPD